MLERGGVGSPIELALRVYGEPFTRERLAALARGVTEAARGGDATALDILRCAAEELATAAETAMRVLGLEAGVVSYAGSVFGAGAAILAPFAAHIAAVAPRARVEPPFLPAIGGALRLARLELGEKEDAAVLETWRAQLGTGNAS
jgi:N-acetylglucosamine kinase-like BadF-type ATPase